MDNAVTAAMTLWIPDAMDKRVPQNGSLLNGTGEQLPHEETDRIEVIVTVSIMYTLAGLAAAILNPIVIQVLLHGRETKQKAAKELRFSMISLALADLMMALLCAPFTLIQELTYRWYFGSVMCPIVLFSQQMAVMTSIFTNLLIGIERFQAVVCPFRRFLPSASRLSYSILAIWLVCFLASCINFIIGRQMLTRIYLDGELIEVYRCMEKWDTPDPVYSSLCFTWILFALTYAGPLCILLFSYGMVSVKIYQMQKLPQVETGTGKSESVSAYSTAKITLMLLYMVGLFALTWLPLHLFFILRIVCISCLTHSQWRILYFACHWLAMSNTFQKPIIYMAMTRNFQQDVTTIFSKVCRPIAKRGRENNDESLTLMERGRVGRNTTAFTGLTQDLNSPENCADNPATLIATQSSRSQKEGQNSVD